jgi:hypothetical protein
VAWCTRRRSKKEKRIHHGGTEDTEKTEERKREKTIRDVILISLIVFTLFLSLGFVFSVSSVPLW